MNIVERGRGVPWQKIHKCCAIRPGVFNGVVNLIFFCLPVKWH